MPGRRGGRGGGHGGSLPREVEVSKKMSWLLRHGAEQEGLKLGPGGYVNLKDVVCTSLPCVSFVSCIIQVITLISPSFLVYHPEMVRRIRVHMPCSTFCTFQL